MQIKPLTLRVVRELLLDENSARAHLSAASGMWIANNTLYVVADDALELGVFTMHSTLPGHTLTIIPGTLPSDATLRKAAKPDFESLTFLPASEHYPNGALLAFGSGSTAQRKRGMVWPLNAQQELVDKPQLFDLKALYAPLEQIFADLNIEGVLVQGDCLKLWQRANNQYRDNAVIEYDVVDLYALIDAKPQNNLCLQPQHIEHYDLGEVASVPLTFTDAFALPDGACLFTAAAENTDNSYADGECVGAAIGLIDQQRQLRWIRPINPTYKIEGISAQQQGSQLQISLVSDADDPHVPAKLLETTIDYAF